MRKRDCKPVNYNYLTLSISKLKAFTGKEEMVKNLEELMLKPLIMPPPDEQKIPLESIRIFRGRHKSVLSVWHQKITRSKPMSEELLKVFRMRYN